MNKMWIVAKREYLFNLRRRSFLFAVFGVPIFTFVVWAVIFLVMSATEEKLQEIGTVGYVDQADMIRDPVIPANQPDLAIPYVEYDSEEAARGALEKGEIGAFFTLPEHYLQTGMVKIYTDGLLSNALEDSIDTLLLSNLSERLEGDVPLARIQTPVSLTVFAADSGRSLTEANIPVLIFLPMIFAFVFLMASNVTSGFLMSGVVEEKSNRVMEMLITSVTPMQLLLGKIVGLGLLGLTQLVVWGVAGFVLLRVGQSAPFLTGIEFPVDMALAFVVYFILSYFLLASLMAGLGAIAGSEEESRQYASIISLIFVIPFFLITTLIEDPNSSLAVALSLIPFTAPMTTLMRMGFTSVPAWQLAASIGILFVTSLVVVWASARVFRWALLLYGKRPSPRELWRVIRSAPDNATVTAHSTQEQLS